MPDVVVRFGYTDPVGSRGPSGETMRPAEEHARYACPACEGDEFQVAEDYSGHAMRACSRCSLLHTRSREFPTSQYDGIYAEQGAYRSMIDTANRTASGELGFSHLWWFKRMGLRWLEQDGRGSLLDVGCGPGTFLLIARERGWEVTGVEPAAEPARLARSFGIEVVNGVLSAGIQLRPSAFDAITCFEVMEHVARPLEMLRTMRDLLGPQGRILLSVPNLDDPFCTRQMIPSAVPPVHINFFNRKSLGEACRAAGLEPVRFFTLPIPTSSVRNVHGWPGFFLRLPMLCAASLLGRADGTTLLALARKR